MSKWIDVKEKIYKKPAEICYCCCYNYVFYYHYFIISHFSPNPTPLGEMRYFKVKISKSFEKKPRFAAFNFFRKTKRMAHTV